MIKVQNVVLHYPLSPLFRGSIKETLFSLTLGRRPNGSPEFIEALKSLSLSVKSGERVGVIGRNGAGKTSLLRMIAGVYPPTSGSIRVHGRIRSLFDLMLGFEPEDNGRENIRHRGYLLGYTKQEIMELEDEIIDFAGLRESIDLPLKTYSAGMNVRLAFSISTALGGDIVLIDEVFAAGDAEFQVRAQERMRDIIKTSACMILVSHDLETISENCTRVLWLDNGGILADGKPGDVIDAYSESLS
ncbi:MAG: ABC transporter ATP-binding protein [Rhizobiaceae bacterium]